MPGAEATRAPKVTRGDGIRDRLSFSEEGVNFSLCQVGLHGEGSARFLLDDEFALEDGEDSAGDAHVNLADDVELDAGQIDVDGLSG